MGAERPASGWFKDPLGRHESRWISDGLMTSLVRDGTVESIDAVTTAEIEAPLVPLVAEPAEQPHRPGLLSGIADVVLSALPPWG